MTTKETLRRKSQKKTKRLRWRRCSKCGGHAETKLKDNPDRWPFFAVIKKCFECGLTEERPWTGGGNGRRIPGA